MIHKNNKYIDSERMRNQLNQYSSINKLLEDNEKQLMNDLSHFEEEGKREQQLSYNELVEYCEMLLSTVSDHVKEKEKIQSEYERVNSEYGKIKSEYERVNCEYEKMKSEYDQLNNKYNQLTTDYHQLKSNIEQHNNTTISSPSSSFFNSPKQLKATLEESKKQVEQTKQSVTTLLSSFAEEETAISQTQYHNLQQQYNQLNDQYEDLFDCYTDQLNMIEEYESKEELYIKNIDNYQSYINTIYEYIRNDVQQNDPEYINEYYPLTDLKTEVNEELITLILNYFEFLRSTINATNAITKTIEPQDGHESILEKLNSSVPQTPSRPKLSSSFYMTKSPTPKRDQILQLREQLNILSKKYNQLLEDEKQNLETIAFYEQLYSSLNQSSSLIPTSNGIAKKVNQIDSILEKEKNQSTPSTPNQSFFNSNPSTPHHDIVKHNLKHIIQYIRELEEEIKEQKQVNDEMKSQIEQLQSDQQQWNEEKDQLTKDYQQLQTQYSNLQIEYENLKETNHSIMETSKNQVQINEYNLDTIIKDNHIDMPNEEFTFDSSILESDSLNKTTQLSSLYDRLSSLQNSFTNYTQRVTSKDEKINQLLIQLIKSLKLKIIQYKSIKKQYEQSEQQCSYYKSQYEQTNKEFGEHKNQYNHYLQKESNYIKQIQNNESTIQQITSTYHQLEQAVVSFVKQCSTFEFFDQHYMDDLNITDASDPSYSMEMSSKKCINVLSLLQDYLQLYDSKTKELLNTLQTVRESSAMHEVKALELEQSNAQLKQELEQKNQYISNENKDFQYVLNQYSSSQNSSLYYNEFLAGLKRIYACVTNDQSIISNNDAQQLHLLLQSLPEKVQLIFNDYNKQKQIIPIIKQKLEKQSTQLQSIFKFIKQVIHSV